jgi:Collagen triple helix repeat (20 copies)
MKKIVITIAATAAFFVPVGTGVLAQSPSPTITVVAEPPGENCEFGGVKVTVTPAEEPEPTPEPTEEPTPDPTEDPTEEPTEEPTEPPTAAAAQAEPEVTYVCNGQPGEPGTDGQDGADGADGDDGTDGMDGFDGTDAEPGTPGIQAAAGERCRTAGVKKLRLPKRFKYVKRVTLTVNSKRTHPRVKRRVVKVNLRRVPCGYYPVLVQRRGVRSWLIVLRLTPNRVVRTSVK